MKRLLSTLLVLVACAPLWAPSSERQIPTRFPTPDFTWVVVEHRARPEPEPIRYKVYRVRVVLKACSPQDPHDLEYYKRHGFKGAAYNLCSDYRVLPKGSRVLLPESAGYMSVSYPDRWWEVDAPGGTWIRRYGTGSGSIWIDVKYRTHYSARKFGSKEAVVDVVLPSGVQPSRILLDNLVGVRWTDQHGLDH